MVVAKLPVEKILSVQELWDSMEGSDKGTMEKIKEIAKETGASTASVRKYAGGEGGNKPKKEKEEEEEEAPKKTPTILDKSLPIKLAPEYSAVAKKLMEMGVANDLNDAVYKGLSVLYAQNFGLTQTSPLRQTQSNTGVKKKEDEVTMAKLDNELKEIKKGGNVDELGIEAMFKQRYMDAMLGRMESQSQNKSDEPMKFPMMLWLMQSMNKGENKGEGMGMMETVMMMKMLDKSNDGGNAQIQALQQQILELKSEIKAGKSGDSDAMLKLMMLQNASQKGSGSEDIIKMYMASDQVVRRKDEQLAAERTQHMRQELTNKLNVITEKVAQGASGNLDTVKKQIGDAKELAKLVESGKKEFDLGDFTTNVLEQVKGPILEPLGQALAQKAAPPPTQPVELTPEMLKQYQAEASAAQKPEQEPKKISPTVEVM